MSDVLEFLKNLFGTKGFFPRDYCRVNWPPYLVWIHNLSDLAIWGAYLAIPAVLCYFVIRKGKPLPFRHVFGLFGIFIFSCGFTHFLEVYTFFVPVYNLSALVKIVTALASWGTVLALFPIAPVALSMKTPTELEREVQLRTQELKEERDKTRDLNANLERLVVERTAELRASNRELESFAYSVAHDLRGPIRTINSFSGMLTETLGDFAPFEALEDLQRIRSASQKMETITNSLLMLSRLSRQEIQKQTVDLSDMAQEAIEHLSESDPEREVDVVITANLKAFADPALARILMVNLLENAWKYSIGKHPARIEVGTENGEFYVRDNGAGFDMEYAAKLFEPFERLHSEKEFMGTGIGLATCYRITAKHGGSIRGVGKVGEGATIYFTL